MASTAGKLLAGFVKGSTGYAVDSMKRREEAEAEMRKAEMLAQLQRETAKDLAMFEENLPGKKLDREAKAQAMQLAREDQVLQRDKFSLDSRNVESTIAARNAELGLSRARLGIDQAESSERIKNYRTQRASLDGSKGKDEKILLAEYQKAFDLMKMSGANEYELSRAQAKWYEGVNQKGWKPTSQRKYIGSLLDTWSTKARALAESGLLPSQIKKED